MLMPQLRRVGIARVDAPGTRYKRFWALVMAADWSIGPNGGNRLSEKADAAQKLGASCRIRYPA